MFEVEQGDGGGMEPDRDVVGAGVRRDEEVAGPDQAGQFDQPCFTRRIDPRGAGPSCKPREDLLIGPGFKWGPRKNHGAAMGIL